MIKVLQFIFQSFWHWLGFTMCLYILISGLAEGIGGIGKKTYITNNYTDAEEGND